MTARFGLGTHFRTYVGESNASLSVHCNVLDALLHLEAPFVYVTRVISATSFVCGAWYTGCMKDNGYGSRLW